jgi:NAD(P)-dependent dehydrogenase (short-subunit alcohol dehydrogenase family)
MQSFAGKRAVITGGGSGIGREIARLLVSEGCSVSLCDVFDENLSETKRLCEANRRAEDVRVTTHLADVSDEAQMAGFRDEVAQQLETTSIDLLFNNAGIGGNTSILDDSVGARREWERTFNICWGGVYFGTRTFLPMLVRSREAHLVNMSSINGFWAMINPDQPRTAYSAAKFAIKGFTEALIGDLRVNAPHVNCSVVMPGHIGTPVVFNQLKIQTGQFASISAGTFAAQSEETVGGMATERARRYLEDAPTTAQEAAETILAGVRAKRWRILVGRDAV